MARANDAAALLKDACRELARAPAVFESLTAGLDAAGWRARPHPTEWSPVEIICQLLHLSQLAGTLTRLWADRWTPLRAEYAGPIPYAGDPGA